VWVELVKWICKVFGIFDTY